MKTTRIVLGMALAGFLGVALAAPLPAAAEDCRTRSGRLFRDCRIVRVDRACPQCIRLVDVADLVRQPAALRQAWIALHRPEHRAGGRGVASVNRDQSLVRLPQPEVAPRLRARALVHAPRLGQVAGPDREEDEEVVRLVE